MGNSHLRSGISKNVFEPKLEKKVINSILGADTVVKHSSESFSTNGREINSRTRDVIVQIHIGYRNAVLIIFIHRNAVLIMKKFCRDNPTERLGYQKV